MYKVLSLDGFLKARFAVRFSFRTDFVSQRHSGLDVAIKGFK